MTEGCLKEEARKRATERRGAVGSPRSADDGVRGSRPRRKVLAAEEGPGDVVPVERSRGRAPSARSGAVGSPRSADDGVRGSRPRRKVLAAEEGPGDVVPVERSRGRARRAPSARSGAVGSPRSADDGVRGSRPRQKKTGELAQLGERLVCIQEVTGSSPVFSTKIRDAQSASPREGVRGSAPTPDQFPTTVRSEDPGRPRTAWPRRNGAGMKSLRVTATGFGAVAPTAL